MEKQEFYTIKDLQKMFKASYPTIHQMIIQERIRAVKFGNRWLIAEEEIERIKHDRVV